MLCTAIGGRLSTEIEGSLSVVNCRAGFSRCLKCDDFAGGWEPMRQVKVSMFLTYVLSLGHIRHIFPRLVVVALCGDWGISVITGHQWQFRDEIRLFNDASISKMICVKTPDMYAVYIIARDMVMVNNWS